MQRNTLVQFAIQGILLPGVLALGLAACGSKKVDDKSGLTASDANNQSPTIESTPMDFSAQGSDSGTIDGLQTVNFEYDRAVLSGNAKSKIAGNADWLKKNPKVGLQIEGHCDQRGSIEYNIALGERRAQSVKTYMVSLGVDSNRLSVISYGKEKPVAQGESEADYLKNRRANFVPLNR